MKIGRSFFVIATRHPVRSVNSLADKYSALIPQTNNTP